MVKHPTAREKENSTSIQLQYKNNQEPEEKLTAWFI